MCDQLVSTASKIGLRGSGATPRVASRRGPPHARLVHTRLRLHLVTAALLGAAACGGRVVFDPSPSGAGGAQGTGGAPTISSHAANSGNSSSGGCPAGTCKVDPSGNCEAPTGPQGNACCKCGPDGVCSELCDCASPDTPIATPTGERAIASLRTGDLVYSVHGMQVVV